MDIKYPIRKALSFISYYNYVLRTRKLDYFQYQAFAHPCRIYAESLKPGILGNKCYGNWKAVQVAMGEDYDERCMIEHGIYFGERILFEECEMNEISTIYTYSPYRVHVLQNYYKGTLGKKVIAVGPYIQYVPNFLSEEVRQSIKQKYGRILLVFPAHPDPSNDTVYDFNEFIQRIEQIKEDFDTVFVSMFWVDILKRKHLFYEKQGYVIVCSGNRSDPYFLSRQRDLIELATMTMSNELGTHIGYSIALDRPHYLFKQKIKLDLTNEDKDIAEDIRCCLVKQKQEYSAIQKAFGNYSFEITDEQKILVDYYWGKNVQKAVEI